MASFTGQEFVVCGYDSSGGAGVRLAANSSGHLLIDIQDTSVAITEAVPTSGGCSVYRNIDLGVTGQVVKASAGQLYGWYLFNCDASADAFVKVYNKATAADENDTPVMTLTLKAGQGANMALKHGIAFATGISVRATTAVADDSTAAPGTNDVIVNLFYK